MRPSAQLALVRLDYTEGAFETALETWTCSRRSSRPTTPRCARTCSPGALAAAGSRAAGTKRSPRRTAAVAALDGLPESPQLARALARLSQIEMLKHPDEAITAREQAIAVARRVGAPSRGERPDQPPSPLHARARVPPARTSWRSSSTRRVEVVRGGRAGRSPTYLWRRGDCRSAEPAEAFATRDRPSPQRGVLRRGDEELLRALHGGLSSSRRAAGPRSTPRSSPPQGVGPDRDEPPRLVRARPVMTCRRATSSTLHPVESCNRYALASDGAAADPPDGLRGGSLAGRYRQERRSWSR